MSSPIFFQGFCEISTAVIVACAFLTQSLAAQETQTYDLPWPGNSRYDTVVVGNFNQDTYDDLIVTGEFTWSTMIFLGSPDGLSSGTEGPEVRWSGQITSSSEADAIEAGDFNGDGLDELVFIRRHSTQSRTDQLVVQSIGIVSNISVKYEDFKGTEVLGASCDGVSNVVIHFNFPGAGPDSEVSMLPLQTDGSEGSIIVPPVWSYVTNRWEAVYRAPHHYPGEPGTNLYEVPIFARVGDIEFSAERPLKLIRTPVLMLHGFLGSAASWQPAARFLRDNGWQPEGRTSMNSGILSIHDYSRTNTASFVENRHVVPEGVKHLLNQVRYHGYIAEKVDLLGHSMGGVLGRQYLHERVKNPITGESYVRKFITVDTPHSGSELANIGKRLGVVQVITGVYGALERLYALNGLSLNDSGGAFNDLAINSAAYKRLNEGPPPTVPSHAIVGDALASGQKMESDQLKMLWRLIESIPHIQTSHGISLGEIYNIPWYDRQMLEEPHDYVVGFTSQSGGLSGSHISVLPVPDHNGASLLDEPNVLERIEDLLSQDLEITEEFIAGGFQDVPRALWPVPGYENNPLTRLIESGGAMRLPDAVSIVIQNEKVSYVPNEDILIEIEASSNVDTIAVLFDEQETLLVDIPFRASVRAPNKISDHPLMVLAYSQGDLIGVDVKVIQVITDEPVHSLSLFQEDWNIQLSDGEEFSLLTHVSYPSGLETAEPLKVADLIFFSFDPRIATVDSSGMVRAQKAGETMVTVSAGNIVESVLISVIQKAASGTLWYAY